MNTENIYSYFQNSFVFLAIKAKVNSEYLIATLLEKIHSKATISHLLQTPDGGHIATQWVRQSYTYHLDQLELVTE